MRTILLHMFDRPRCVLGRWGGNIMARMNEDCGFWVADLLKSDPRTACWNRFLPGVMIQHLSGLASVVTPRPRRAIRVQLQKAPQRRTRCWREQDPSQRYRELKSLAEPMVCGLSPGENWTRT